AAGRRWRDEPTALLAGAIVATSFGYFSIGRLSLPDLPLAFFITLTIYAALVATETEPRVALRWWLLAGFAAGSGFLTKGPLGIIIPALVVAPAWWQARHRLRGHLRGIAAAAGVALLVGVPWYVAMTVVHGRAYLDSFFIGDNLERFATDRFN